MKIRNLVLVFIVSFDKLLYFKITNLCNCTTNCRCRCLWFWDKERVDFAFILPMPSCCEHYPKNRQVASSIPEVVIGIFQWHKPSGRTMALGSTRLLTEMSARCISWGKGGRCVRLTTLPTFCAVVMKSGNINFLEHSGPLQACNGAALRLPSCCDV
jgi:hypothetical protein